MSSDKVHAGQGAQLKAAALLVTDGALVELSAADARQVVGYMQPQRVSAGRVVIRAGDARRNDFMALVLDGEVTVEHAPGAMHESMVVSVLGPGSYAYTFAVPNNPALVGFGPLNWQAASLVVPTGEFALSNGSEWWLGV